MDFPIEAVRAEFPALSVRDDGRERIYFDAPGGTQVCRAAIRAMADHMERGTANAHGVFATSHETDRTTEAARAGLADLLGADPGEIAIGPNMTSLTFAVSRALATGWGEGDEIVLTRLDHDANVAPWLLVARDRGMTVRWIDIDPEAGTLRLDLLPGLLGPRTRLVAVGAASNAIGTITDIAEVSRIVRAHSSALLFVDAVQLVPHVPVDVAALGCDLLACSLYKIFGPHQGALWGRAALLDAIGAYKVRPSATQPPAVRFETGAASFESHAAIVGMIDYLDDLGRRFAPEAADRRARLTAAMRGCLAYEHALGERLIAGLRTIDGLKLYGPPGMEGRVPTFGFTIEGMTPDIIVRHLAAANIFAWAGSFYAVEPIARMGLTDKGGLARVGLCHYHSEAEVDRLIEVLRGLPR